MFKTFAFSSLVFLAACGGGNQDAENAANAALSSVSSKTAAALKTLSTINNNATCNTNKFNASKSCFDLACSQRVSAIVCGPI